MKKLASDLIFPKKLPRISLKTEIFFGSEQGGSQFFPRDIETIITRRFSPEPRPLEVFRMAVMNAVDRIWIIDEYFFIPDQDACPDSRIGIILDWLHIGLVANDIRILTKKHDVITQSSLEIFRLRELEINSRQARRLKQCSIQINTNLTQNFDYVHDRFAIVDDELWHFGATVGGFHASVNAASRGWNAIDLGAIEFFELAWNKCKEKKNAMDV